MKNDGKKKICAVGSSIFNRPANLYVKKLQHDKWVCFNPDAYGGAVVVSDEVMSVIDTHPVFGLDAQRIMAIVNTLIGRGIIESCDKISNPNQLPAKNAKSTMTYWLHTTNHCNLACTYCYVKKSCGAMELETMIATIQKIIDDCQSRGVTNIGLKFAGGEPVLAFPVICKAVEFAKRICPAEMSVNFGLLTNGTLITLPIAKFLKEEKFSVSVSLDGPALVNNKTRIYKNGSGSYKKIILGISMLRSVGINPLILTVLSPENVPFLDVFMNWLIDEKLSSRFSFSRDVSFLSACNLEEYNAHLTKHLFKAYDSLIKRLPFYRIADFHNLGNLSFERPARRYCGVGSSGLAVTHGGLYAPCQESLNAAQKIKTGENHLDLLKLQKRFDFKKTIDDVGGCKNCQWKRVCAGDCIELKQQLWGRWDCSSPYCQTLKAVIPKLIDLRGWQLIRAQKEIKSHEKS